MLTRAREKKFRLIYGIIILILVPVFFVFSALAIVKKYDQLIEKQQQRHLVITSHTIAALVKPDLYWPTFVQARLDLLMEGSSEILEIKVLQRKEEGFIVIASSDQGEVNSFSSEPFFDQFQYKPLTSVYIDKPERMSAVGAVGQNLFSSANWHIILPINKDTSSQTLLSVKFSSATDDHLIQSHQKAIITLLAATALAIFVFLLTAVRLLYSVFFVKNEVCHGSLVSRFYQKSKIKRSEHDHED